LEDKAGMSHSSDAVAGVFSSGSWPIQRRRAYANIVEMVERLPVTGRLRTVEDQDLSKKVVKAVRDFARNLPDWKAHNGIAAWHEGTLHVLKQLRTLGCTFATELDRRHAVMQGHRSYGVTLEAPLAKRKLLPNTNVPKIIWHVVVEEHCNMEQLLEAISKEAHFCSSADLASVKGLVGDSNFHIGQYRNPTGKESSTSKPKVHYAEQCEELVFSDGYFDVYATRKPRKARERNRKKKSAQAHDVKGTQETADGNATNGQNNTSSPSADPKGCILGWTRPLRSGSRLPINADPRTDSALDQKSEAPTNPSPKAVPHQKAEAPTVPLGPAAGSRNGPCVDKFKFSQDADSRNTILLRMGHTAVEVNPNGFCGYYSLSEMYCVLSPFDVVMYWRAVFFSRVAEKATRRSRQRREGK
jgi:hypothetical protein